MCPELSEVNTMKDRINQYIQVDSICIDIIIHPFSRYYESTFFGHSELHFPAKFKSATSRGKKIILTFEEIKTNNKFFLLISPLLTGVIRFDEGNHTSISLIFENNKQLVIDDVRKMGLLEGFSSEKELIKRLEKVGPDFLNDDITIEEYTLKLRNKRSQNTPIYNFLLDQSKFSGVGNYLAAEILYAAKISPFRKLRDLSDSDICNLLSNSKLIIQLSYEANGFSIRDYVQPTGEPGSFKCLVYGQKVDPFGNPVTRTKMSNGRTAHYVPNIQI